MLLRLSEDLHAELSSLAAHSDEPVSVVTRRALRAGLHALYVQQGIRTGSFGAAPAAPPIRLAA